VIALQDGAHVNDTAAIANTMAALMDAGRRVKDSGGLLIQTQPTPALARKHLEAFLRDVMRVSYPGHPDEREILPGVTINRNEVASATFGPHSNGGGVIVITKKDGSKVVHEAPSEKAAEEAVCKLTAD